MTNEQINRYIELRDKLIQGSTLTTFEGKEFFMLLRTGLQNKNITFTTCVSCVKNFIKNMNKLIDVKVEIPVEEIVQIEQPVIESQLSIKSNQNVSNKKNKNKKK